MSEIITQCWQAYDAAGFQILAAPDVRWVMNLAAYKRIRAAVKAITGDDGDDPGTWEPQPGDRMMAMPIEVREDGGNPHLEAPGLRYADGKCAQTAQP